MTSAGSIQRVRGRDAFRRLARDGQRIRRRALWCSWCPEPSSTTPSVAFALSRALGPAVTRNLLRRRLRAICRGLTAAGELPPGLLLIGASPAVTELTYAQLATELRSIVSSIRATTTTPTDPPTDPPPADTMPLTRADAPST